jgi:dipeptidase E
MRLFLASYQFGNYEDEFRKLIGDNHKILVVTNSRDHLPVDLRQQKVTEAFAKLSKDIYSCKELDLRQYFHKSDELKRFIDDYKPGCIFAIGGNIYSLATALHLSGLDEILKEGLESDRYVYAGYSAGAVVASNNLSNIIGSYGERPGDLPSEAESAYGEVWTKGLGLIDEYICPHADQGRYCEISKQAAKDLTNKKLKALPLKDAEVLIIDGSKKKIFGLNDTKSCGCIIVHDGKALLIGAKDDDGKLFWSFPKGHQEKDESDIETALRETKEEVGLDVEITDFTPVIAIHPIRDNTAFKRILLFPAKPLNFEIECQEDEVEQVEWVPIDQVNGRLKGYYLEAWQSLQERYSSTTC